MKVKVIKQGFDKGFSRGSKIMEYKLGINQARLLNTLIYKHNYWVGREELVEINGVKAFYITIPNLQVETNMGTKTIQRCLDKLKKSGLINVYRKGIPAQNYYVLNKEAIEGFDEKYESEYEEWAKKVYGAAESERARFENVRDVDQENGSVSLSESQIGQIVHTGKAKMTELDRTELPVTKNKSTKNKKLKTFTNRTSAEIDFFEFEEELQLRIEHLQQADHDQLEGCSTELYEFFQEKIPMFEGFVVSKDDMECLKNLAACELDSAGIASKIIMNVRSISDGSKDTRFGNLFVGLREISCNTDLKHTG